MTIIDLTTFHFEQKLTHTEVSFDQFVFIQIHCFEYFANVILHVSASLVFVLIVNIYMIFKV